MNSSYAQPQSEKKRPLQLANLIRILFSLAYKQFPIEKLPAKTQLSTVTKSAMK
ncbi:MAG: hypothetical protein QHH18_07085 [Candidatus Bathyarchaeota archaeon]|jgi:uracil phosphoribosyltransferase|nr:hypothetical protein [Candidatus Bathyarchaeota archaeon]